MNHNSIQPYIKLMNIQCQYPPNKIANYNVETLSIIKHQNYKNLP